MRRRGFTLLELVVAMGLVVVMAGVVVAGFRNYSRQQGVRTTQARVRQLYQQARSQATSGKMDCAACGGADLKCDGLDDAIFMGWRVRVVGGNQMALEGACGTATFGSSCQQP